MFVGLKMSDKHETLGLYLYIHIMQLFDFIRIFFEDPKEFKELSRYDKAKQFFMLNRFMSIMYPGQANMLNHIKISQAGVVDFWQRNMTNVYTKVPNWIFAKGQKKASGDKTKSMKLPDKSMITKYLILNRLSQRDLDDAYVLYGDSAYDPIRRMEKVFKQ